jgi:DNA-binding MarR family transcriptional regulator
VSRKVPSGATAEPAADDVGVPEFVPNELGDVMRRYQRATDLFDEAVAAKLGLNRTDFRCLDILDQQAPMTAGALAEASRLSTGAVTFVLDRMESAGFIRRRRDESDRRRVVVELVPAARQRAQGLHMPMVRDARQALGDFTPDEVALVCRFLRVSTEVFERNVPE